MKLPKRLVLPGLLLIGVLTGSLILLQKPKGEWRPLKTASIQEAIYGLATLEALESFRYKPAVTSFVRRVFVKEGDQVSKGSPLLALAEGPQIRSPIRGVVNELIAKEEETVFATVPLLSVVNLERLELSITLEQASAIQVRPGQRVRIQFESLKADPIEGHVRTVYPKDGQFFIKVGFQTSLKTLLPGMTADTAIIVGEKPLALLAPTGALQKGSLLLRSNGREFRITPRTGLRDSESVEVFPDPAHGLDPGASVWVPKP